MEEKRIRPRLDDPLYQAEEYVPEFLPNGKPDLAKITFFLQNLALDHVKKLGLGEDYQREKSFLYVVCRMRGVFLHPIHPGEKLTGVTYTLTPNLIDMTRYAYLLNEKDEPVFFLTSLWILLDPKTRRIKPARFYRDDLLKILPQVKEKKKIEGTDLSALDFSSLSFGQEEKYVVQPQDIDANKHMNNTAYLRISQNDSSFKNITSYEINFEKECFLNETLSLAKCDNNNEEDILGTKENGELSFKLKFLGER